ncbi:MAG TPA: hypothetical protein PLD47_01845 [Aggregatilineales bacterium]|nr:hypothetical protein [Anaerolineales bacterium]HRE46441.1 hypothetical protein [Aggregatilineales bacterium]
MTVPQAGKPENLILQGEIRRFVVGVVAIFGVEDRETYKELAYKYASLSDRCAPLGFSKMGFAVPDYALAFYEGDTDEPEDTSDRLVGGQQKRRCAEDDLHFNFRERFSTHKCFIIGYLESLTSAGEPAFAYVNVRGDRICKLLYRGINEASAYSLADFATLILTGQGTPTKENRQKLAADYLFSLAHEDGVYDEEGYTRLRGDHVNIRLFPPLNQVT